MDGHLSLEGIIRASGPPVRGIGHKITDPNEWVAHWISLKHRLCPKYPRADLEYECKSMKLSDEDTLAWLVAEGFEEATP
jgi:hypothetical protein